MRQIKLLIPWDRWTSPFQEVHWWDTPIKYLDVDDNRSQSELKSCLWITLIFHNRFLEEAASYCQFRRGDPILLAIWGRRPYLIEQIREVGWIFLFGTIIKLTFSWWFTLRSIFYLEGWSPRFIQKRRSGDCAVWGSYYEGKVVIFQITANKNQSQNTLRRVCCLWSQEASEHFMLSVRPRLYFLY